MNSETAILIAATLATVGWIYTAYRARNLARKQHTINVILQASLNDRFIEKRDLIAPHIKSGECPKKLLDGSDEELRRNFRDILNHYEFVSAGLRNGDFDEKLVCDSERGTYVALFECCEPYIWKLRDNRKRMTIYEHLEWVHRRWEKRPPNRGIKAVEWFIGRPLYGHTDQNRPS